MWVQENIWYYHNCRDFHNQSSACMEPRMYYTVWFLNIEEKNNADRTMTPHLKIMFKANKWCLILPKLVMGLLGTVQVSHLETPYKNEVWVKETIRCFLNMVRSPLLVWNTGTLWPRVKVWLYLENLVLSGDKMIIFWYFIFLAHICCLFWSYLSFSLHPYTDPQIFVCFLTFHKYKNQKFCKKKSELGALSLLSRILLVALHILINIPWISFLF